MRKYYNNIVTAKAGVNKSDLTNTNRYFSGPEALMKNFTIFVQKKPMFYIKHYGFFMKDLQIYII